MLLDKQGNEIGLFCGDCEQDCQAVIKKEWETDEFWGARSGSWVYYIHSDCCLSEVYTRRAPDGSVFQEAEVEDVEDSL